MVPKWSCGLIFVMTLLIASPPQRADQKLLCRSWLVGLVIMAGAVRGEGVGSDRIGLPAVSGVLLADERERHVALLEECGEEGCGGGLLPRDVIEAREILDAVVETGDEIPQKVQTDHDLQGQEQSEWSWEPPIIVHKKMKYITKTFRDRVMAATRSISRMELDAALHSCAEVLQRLPQHAPCKTISARIYALRGQYALARKVLPLSPSCKHAAIRPCPHDEHWQRLVLRSRLSMLCAHLVRQVSTLSPSG